MLMQRLTRGHAELTIWRGPELFGGREVTDFELNQLDVSPTLPRCAGGSQYGSAASSSTCGWMVRPLSWTVTAMRLARGAGPFVSTGRQIRP